LTFCGLWVLSFGSKVRRENARIKNESTHNHRKHFDLWICEFVDCGWTPVSSQKGAPTGDETKKEICIEEHIELLNYISTIDRGVSKSI